MRKIQFQGEKNMCVKSEASTLLREIVAPPWPGESVKALIRRASRKSGLTVSRATKLWYGLCARIDAEEIDRLRELAGNAKTGGAASATIIVDREYFESVKASLADLHRKVDALQSKVAVENARRAGGLAR